MALLTNGGQALPGPLVAAFSGRVRVQPV